MGPPAIAMTGSWVCNALLVAQEAVEARTTNQLPVMADLNRIQKVESVAGGSQVHVEEGAEVPLKLWLSFGGADFSVGTVLMV